MLTIRTVAQRLAADFALRGVGATVVFGNWQPEQHAGADRVVVGLGDFDTDAMASQPPGYTPGPVINGATAASTLALHLQEAIVWVHGVGPAGTPDEERIDANHDRTSVLLHATIAGLRRALGYGSLILGKGQWPTVDTGDVTYGALCRFRFAVAVPVLGDPLNVLPKPQTVEATMQMGFAGGTQDGPTIAATGPE